MKSDERTFDAVAETDDVVEVRIQVQPFGKGVLYIDVNGQTVARIGHIDPGTVQVELDDEFSMNRLNRNAQVFVAGRRHNQTASRSRR